MKIAVMKEMHEGETRVPLIPATVDKLIKLGAEVEIESGLGLSCRFTDADYEKVGAKINPDRKVMLQSADIILRLRKPPIDEIDMMKEGCIHISYLDPFKELELVDRMKACKISAVSLEMLPRANADKIDIQRAREVLDELRRRIGDPSRTTLELDYLERLIRSF